jgi:uncharacterized membrane protein
MATISVLKFDDPDGADRALGTVEGLSRDHLIEQQEKSLRHAFGEQA